MSIVERKKLFTKAMVAILLAATPAAAVVAAKRPALADGAFTVQQAGAAPVALNQLHALAVVVVDPHLSSSRELLDALNRSGFQGAGLVVLVAGGTRQADVLRLRSAALPQARWVSAEASAVQRGLQLAGTPVVLGLDLQQRVAWRESGLPAVPLHLALRIAEWTQAATPEVR